MLWITYNKEEKKRTRPFRILLFLAFLIGSLYGSYTLMREKEETISIALETPEGRRALAEAMIEAAKHKD